MFESISYWRWKRKAKRAIQDGLTAECAVCDDPVVPGDFVATGKEEGESIIVHAGYHFSLTSRYAFCVTGALGTGTWDGRAVVNPRESIAAATLRTGESQEG